MPFLKMKAVVCYEPRHYALEEVHLTEPQGDEIAAKVLACGICASDVKCYDGANNFWKGNPPFVRPPFIPGHEFIAEVVELGDNHKRGKHFKVGDRIVSEQIIPCGRCRFCQTGHYWMCEVHNIYGFRGKIADGAMAEYIKFPAKARNYEVPKTVSHTAGALIEPLACATHAVQRGRIRFSDVVSIAGAGTLGLLMLQVVKMKNPKKIIVIDPQPNRLMLAKEIGADVILDPQQINVVSQVMEITEGYGCDVYIEASGSPKSVNNGLQMIRKLGRFVHFGISSSLINADWNIIGDQKELTILGSHLSPYTYPLAIHFLEEGLVRTEGILTHQFSLEQFKEAFRVAQEQEKEKSIKVMVVP